MTRLGLILLAMIIGFCMTLSPQSEKKKTRNRVPVIQSFTSSLNPLIRCPTPAHIECTDPETTLRVVAYDPDNDVLSYRYDVTGGKIFGEGASVVWSLKDVPDGTFQATVFVHDKKGGSSTTVLSIVVKTDGLCCLGDGVCPVISVACPSTIDAGQRAVFTVTVSGGSTDIKPTYSWRVDSGRIIKGQGTAEIEVDPSELRAKEVTATVTVGGYDPNCSVEASCTVRNVLEGKKIERLAKPCPERDVVKVVCPTTYTIGERAVFSAELVDPRLEGKITYSWRSNWGRIVDGQGTSKLVVQHNDHWGDALTATVSIDGLDPSCSKIVASCSSKIVE